MTKIDIRFAANRPSNTYLERIAKEKETNKKMRVYVFAESCEAEGLSDKEYMVAARQTLSKVAIAAGYSADTKFRWSQKAGCSCGCSPGFICDDIKGVEAFVSI